MKQPSEGYRFGLSQELRSLRGRNKAEAREHLTVEKQTHAYRLAEVLYRNRKQEHEQFDRREFDEKTPSEDLEIVLVSNEPSLFETFEYIKDVSGAGVGVGFDQMLDVAVNSKLEDVFITDINPPNLFATRGLLEVGRKFHMLHGRYPSPEEYLAFFEPKNLPLTLEMIESEFSRKELNIIRNAYGKCFYYESSVVLHSNAVKGPPAVHHYLSYKAGQTDYNSWLSSQKNLEKVICMYEERHLRAIRADLAGSESIPLLGKNLAAKGAPLSLLYISNTLEFLTEYGRMRDMMGDVDNFFHNLGELPVSDQTMIVHTGRYSRETKLPPSLQKSDDRYLKQFFHQWSYVVQSMRSYRQFSEQALNIGNPCYVMRAGLRVLFQRGGHHISPKPGVYIIDVPMTSK